MTEADPGAAEELRSLIMEGRNAHRQCAWADAHARYDAAFARLAAAGRAELVAELFYWAGWPHFFRQLPDVAEEAFLVSRTVAELNGLDELAAQARVGLAAVETQRGHVAEAERVALEARAIADRCGNARLVAVLDANLSTMAMIRGDVGTAIMRSAAALGRFEALGDRQNAAKALLNLAKAHGLLGEWDAAEAKLQAALALVEGLGDRHTQAAALVELADLARKRAALDAAKAYCDRALDILREIGAKDWTADVYQCYGALYREQGEIELAEAHLALALKLAEGCADPLRIGEVEAERATLFLSTEREVDALRALNRAHESFVSLGARPRVADLQRRLEEVERASLLGVTDWAATIDERECSEPGHADAVAACAATLAEAAGVGGRELHWIKVGAYLHDVGKAAVPASILRKAGPLTPTERELVQLHAAAGDELVAGLRFPAAVRLAVRHHHERWDGAGYPDGLAGEAIPLPARIVGLASVWCALTQRRSFRPAFSRAEALRLMAGEAGRGTDPALFGVLAALAERRAEAPPLASDAAWRAGDAFVARLQRVLGARYVLRHEIAGGGMSRIFVASEPRLGRDVVVKTVPPELITAESRARFKQEMGVTARLQHPGVLPVLSSGGRHDVLFYVMPYVSGDSLRQRMQREGALPAAAALGLLDELLDVLEYAHGRGVVHRDIKPENVLLRGPHPLLADFGVARVLSEARLTGTGIAVGTPAYMAPEQRFAEDAADARADLYALGVVAYELLAGQHPFPDARSRLAAQLTGTVTPLHEVGRAVPPAVSAVIATALAPEPERRHQSAAAFRATLRVAAADARASV